MGTKRIMYFMTFFVLFNTVDLKGQRGIPALFPDTISFQHLSICDENIAPVLKYIDSCWTCSSFSDIFSYATMTPHKDTMNGVLWNITIEQLYDYPVFTVNLLGWWCPFFTTGLVVFNNRRIIVGVLRDSSERNEDSDSKSIVEQYFCCDNDTVSFTRSSTEKIISESEFIYRRDTVVSECGIGIGPPEIHTSTSYPIIKFDVLDFNGIFTILGDIKPIYLY
ncbi:MAG: hypothetical protein PUB29_08460 [Bacteroidales bacterium]|nr:hypothetical protein [Bacteroidales bacterium]MDD6185640.1 hypothetical protein [Bacteroidales bacterium]